MEFDWGTDSLRARTAVAVASLFGIVRICSGLRYGTSAKILFMVLAFVPFFAAILRIPFAILAGCLAEHLGLPVMWTRSGP